VQGVQDLAAWILKENPNWSGKDIDAEIATGKRTTVRLARPMPVAWIYLTGWASQDGTIHFRKDVYDLDPKPAVATTIDVGRPIRVSAARASGFVLQSDDEPVFRQVSYLDSR
jgi:murein L,D-transpeptidase YcbB/YkuD